MLSNSEFVRQSLELNLFFTRTAKEHAIFLESGLTPKNNNITFQTEVLRNEFRSLSKSFRQKYLHKSHILNVLFSLYCIYACISK
ncbi:DUF2935 domain-containing protein [Clostridium sp. BJN0013]|uniref:DUF2935 domain-containing protein n=1 Tax=Clostridium sp. BJN0013 TaxID=3236840 RepID=UPI0034C626DE